MKIKSKKKKIILCCCISLILLLLLAAVYIFQFTGLGYRMSVPYRSSFEKVADNIYVNKNYSGNIKEAIQLTEEALERDRAFFGELQCTDTTIIIFCDDDKLLSKLDGDHDTKTSYTKKNYISVSDEYLNIDIIAHELTHAELHTRLNVKALKSIPTWFDEGLATQNDYREQYGLKAWIEQTYNGKNTVPLEDMDTGSEFYADPLEDRRFRYLNAKHEVSVWMDTHQQKGLLELLDKLNKGKDFDSVYSR
ncbi:hypothetical protein [Ruminococcus flavefaciens]|uniref:Peptidase MA-like domain-containing protein n=1 Tax=Ruminococcus flavefaciens 007c TaxID=1341157 RepID=W7UEI4_RUMFL|nr:hypothetical protein [Ruminococcus flavefaciens]EWM53571.1 hypothetical protein RF007C_05795 [Ruminococcus flavefaciens 007c]